MGPVIRSSTRRVLACVTFSLGCALPASAQVVWNAPAFFSPRPMDDIGIYVFKTSLPFDDPTGLIGIWRQSGNVNLGVRAGVASLDDPGGNILVGAELSGPLNSLLPGTSLDLAWNLGAGAVFGDCCAIFSIPLGVSLGTLLRTGRVSILPYVHPRLSLDIESLEIQGREETETHGAFAIDLGADITLGSSLVLRLGGSLGDWEAFGVGLALHWPRGISVGSGN